MTIELTDEKRLKAKQKIKNTSTISVCSIQSFAEFVGTLTAYCPAVKYGWTHTKAFERAKYLPLKKNNGNYKAKMILSKDLQPEFIWWSKVIFYTSFSTKAPRYVREIFSDASLTGWGVACKNQKTHGFWSTEERRSHINVLELKAALFGLECYASNLRSCDVLLRLDNTTAITYINTMGGIRYENLNKIARSIWGWCEERNLCTFASYIRSKDNIVADFESRRLEPETEYRLSDTAFKKIVREFGNPEIDLFASRINKKCEKYVSWIRNPGSAAVDALTLPWTPYFFYAFPPFTVILRVLQKKKMKVRKVF